MPFSIENSRPPSSSLVWACMTPLVSAVTVGACEGRSDSSPSFAGTRTKVTGPSKRVPDSE